MSIVGIFENGTTYCFHLLHIVVRNNILIRVLKSITKNGSSLLMVTLLGIIVIYIYAVVGFAFFREFYVKEKGLWCETLFQCLITSLAQGSFFFAFLFFFFFFFDDLNWNCERKNKKKKKKKGVRLAGGIGDSLGDDEGSWELNGVKALYTFSFFVIVSTIGLSVIFGIIVDTFSELRDEKFKIDENMREYCFICSLPRFFFSFLLFFCFYSFFSSFFSFWLIL